jgi:hypothetical protein
MPTSRKMRELMPADTPEYMFDAWIGCMLWAIGEQDIRERFEVDTGFRWVPPRNALDQMVDDATGFKQQYLEAFIRWANVYIWGPIEGVEK